MIFKVDDNTFINYNEESQTAEVIKKSEVEADLEIAQRNTQVQLSDKELLEWAKANQNLIPQIKQATEASAKVDALQQKLDSLANPKIKIK